MKKVIILFALILISFFISSCVMDTIYYCVYCGSSGVEKLPDGNFKCTKSDCDKTFGAKKNPKPEDTVVEQE